MVNCLKIKGGSYTLTGYPFWASRQDRPGKSVDNWIRRILNFIFAYGSIYWKLFLHTY